MSISIYECQHMNKMRQKEVGYCDVHGDWSTRELDKYNWNDSSVSTLYFEKIRINGLPLYQITLTLPHRFFKMIVHCVFCSETHIRQTVRPLINVATMHEEDNCFLECEDYVKNKGDIND